MTDLRGIVEKFDADKNGEISFSEFVTIMIDYANGVMYIAGQFLHLKNGDSSIGNVDHFVEK